MKKNNWQKWRKKLFVIEWNYVSAWCAEQSLHGSLPCAEQSLHCSLPGAEQIPSLCFVHRREQCRLCSAHGAETQLQEPKKAKIVIFANLQKIFFNNIVEKFVWPIWPLLREKIFWGRVPLNVKLFDLRYI